MKNNYSNPHFLMLLYTVLVSGSFHIGHFLVNYMDSTVLTFVRFLMGSVLFGIYVFPRYEVRVPSPSDLARYFAISASMIFYFWAMFEALRYTTPLNTAITYTVVPLFSAVYGIFLLKERVSLRNFIVLLAAMFGAMWVIIDGSPSRLVELDFNKGDIIFLIGCLCIGLYSPLSKKLHKGEPMPVLTLWTMITGTVWLLLIANVKILEINIRLLDAAFFAGVAYITVFATIATFFIVQYSSKKLPVSKVMSYIYLTPIFVIIIQTVIGKGLPHAAVIPGIATSVIATFYFLRS
ncbi:DMT family transporter [Geovibrio thiophilus]|uniref:DMT family transporter n=1 Tax=Geovibrio thiophilus TaxID=139438 RepID=A0A3R5UU31_9BACT|nr:DMT family transporter [Geovibrio thiophilus]QAR32502.1 DMT family transporter [Geovibrio thiophilus]